MRAGFLSEIWNSLVDVHICFFMAGLNTASCVPEPAPEPNCMHFQFFFSPFNSLASGRRKKKKRNEATYSGLDTYKTWQCPWEPVYIPTSIWRNINIYGAPCFPSLHYTHRPCRFISPDAVSESNELQQGPEPRENALCHLHSYLLSQGRIASGCLLKHRLCLDLQSTPQKGGPRALKMKWQLYPSADHQTVSALQTCRELLEQSTVCISVFCLSQQPTTGVR